MNFNTDIASLENSFVITLADIFTNLRINDANSGEPGFSQTNRQYDVGAYNNLCTEFEILNTIDFCLRQKHKENKIKVYLLNEP